MYYIYIVKKHTVGMCLKIVDNFILPFNTFIRKNNNKFADFLFRLPIFLCIGSERYMYLSENKNDKKSILIN